MILPEKSATFRNHALTRLHDLDGNVIAEYDGAGALLSEYIWVDGRPVGMVADAGTASPKSYSVLTDHLERPIMMVDDSRAIVWRATYLPFGEVSTISGPAVLDYRFPGQWFHLETGLAYNWHRTYDPSIGRYLQPDPLGMPDGPSRYAYVGNSPLMGVDPTGLQAGQLRKPGPGWIWMTPPFCPPFIDDGYRDSDQADDDGKQFPGGRPNWTPAPAPNSPLPGFTPSPAQPPVLNNDKSPNSDKDPTTPTGQRNHEIEVKPGSNRPATIGDRDYSGHALDQMQGRGMPPSVVEDIIQNGTSKPGHTPGTTVHSGPNGVVVVNENGGVITAWPNPAR